MWRSMVSDKGISASLFSQVQAPRRQAGCSEHLIPATPGGGGLSATWTLPHGAPLDGTALGADLGNLKLRVKGS